MKLSSENVRSIMLDCLFTKDEDTSHHILADGVRTKVGFHPGRVESHRKEIEEMLLQLPDQFHAGKGGGWTFLNACNNKDGELWTGEHQIIDELIMLGQAIGAVEFACPRDMWSIFPGGMPYFTVNVKDVTIPA